MKWMKTEALRKARQRLKSKTHLSCEVIPSRQVFEAEETVPLAGSTSAGVIVHNLAWRHKISSIIHLVFLHCLCCFLSLLQVCGLVSVCAFLQLV